MSWFYLALAILLEVSGTVSIFWPLHLNSNTQSL